MVREIWYRHLAIADRLIVEARDCIDNQKQHLSVLEQDGEDISRAAAQLHLLAQTLQLNALPPRDHPEEGCRLRKFGVERRHGRT